MTGVIPAEIERSEMRAGTYSVTSKVTAWVPDTRSQLCCKRVPG
jgi:hypothetical protein